MIYAAINLDEALTSILLEYNADADVRDREMKTALFYAIDQDKENMQIIENLKNYTNLKQEGSNSMTLLMVAIKRGHFNSLNSLLEQGAFIDQTQKTTGFFDFLIVALFIV